MVKVTRLINPQRKRKAARPAVKRHRRPAAKPRKARKSNPGTLYTLGFLNPTRSKTVKKKAHKKPRRAGRRQNPVVRVTAKKARPRRRRNPSRAGVIGASTGMLKQGLLALFGLLIARQLPQFALGASNKGILGYLSNFATAVAAGMATSKFVGKSEGNSVAIGGMLYLANRVITEKFSPIGQALSLSGLGDATANTSLGRYTTAYSPMPVYRDAAGNPIIPRQINAAAAVAAVQPQAQPSKVAGLSRVTPGRI